MQSHSNLNYSNYPWAAQKQKKKEKKEKTCCCFPRQYHINPSQISNIKRKISEFFKNCFIINRIIFINMKSFPSLISKIHDSKTAIETHRKPTNKQKIPKSLFVINDTWQNTFKPLLAQRNSAENKHSNAEGFYSNPLTKWQNMVLSCNDREK